MQCPYAYSLGCRCAGCGGGYCPNSAAHCTCFYCVTCCFGPLAHGGSSSGGSGSFGVSFGGSFGGSFTGSAGTVTVHFTGGGGSIVSSTGTAHGSFSGPASRPRASRAGMAGFDGRGSADFDLAPGRVLGLRQWSVPPPDLSGNPLATSWNPQYIAGAAGRRWTNSVFEARCNSDPAHRPPVDVDNTGAACGCGCWAYFSPSVMSDWCPCGYLALTGIIEGTGRVLIGEKGFRCQRARIVALTLSSLIRPVVRGPREQVTEQELAQAQQTADAWMAVIGDRIGLLFPDARMFATGKGMLAAFPLGEKFE